MMRPISVVLKPKAPGDLALAVTGKTVNLSWTDNSINETAFVVQRATDAGFTANVQQFIVGENVTVYADSAVANSTTYYYRVYAVNVVGDVSDYTGGNAAATSFPNTTAASGFSNSPMLATPAIWAPTGLTGTAALQGQRNARVTLTWTDNSGNETGFTVQRATDAGFTANLATDTIKKANTTTFTTGNLARGTTYYFRVRANNGTPSEWSNVFQITTP